MISSTEEPSPIAVRAAAEHFIRALRMTAGIARTARVETTLMVVPQGGLFTADLTLAQLWPKDGAPPAQEVIWSHPDSARSWMKLAAFDAEGRVLLRQAYPLLAGQQGVSCHV
jgi:hypothetical protein